jgi:phosphate transport system substrate-binding protein
MKPRRSRSTRAPQFESAVIAARDVDATSCRERALAHAAGAPKSRVSSSRQIPSDDFVGCTRSCRRIDPVFTFAGSAVPKLDAAIHFGRILRPQTQELLHVNAALHTLRASAVVLVLAATAAAQGIKVDEKIPEYKPVQGVSGSIKTAGSQTMSNMMTLWSEGFKKSYPGVDFAVEAKGSGTAPGALIQGTATFGPMSRPMKAKEIDDFEKAFGYKPTQIPTAIDMIAVYVHKDNPIKGLTLAQVDAIFSKTRKREFEKDIVTWGDLGLTGDWANKPISLYGRDTASGTHDYFQEHALAKGDFKSTVKEQAGSSAVVQAVANDKYAIGYSGIGLLTADVRAVPLAEDAKSKFIEAKMENAYSGEYPISRFLYLYVNYKPNSELDPLRREFIRFVLSRQGQECVVKDGFFPLTAKLDADAFKAVGLTPPAAVEAGAARGSKN